MFDKPLGFKGLFLFCIVPRILPSILLISTLLVVYALYSPAFDAGFQFDDAPNLEDLAKVDGPESAILFVLQGKAGPLGRPIALSSFLLNAPAWPSDPASFLYTNVLIHLLNGLLLTYFALLLGRVLPQYIKYPEWFALTTGTIWLLSPLLASTSLMVIQRMTSLSATFVLMGLIGYMAGRSRIQTQPRLAIALMSVSITFGTLLAAFTKENGALLPLYILVLESTLLTQLTLSPSWHLWLKRIFLGIPALLLLGYFVVNWPQLANSFDHRTFTLSERFITETRVLWDYVYHLLIPRRIEFAPYHDDYPASSDLFTPISTLFSCIAWLSVISIAWATRRRTPVFAFAVLWFLAGHLLESTFLSLELYFEHRNYIPSIGPLLALTYTAFSVRPQLFRVSVTALIVFISLEGIVLAETTRVWGSPYLAATLWHQSHPNSARASQFLSQQHLLHQDFEAARGIIEQTWLLNPRRTDLALQTLQLYCSDKNPDTLDGLVDRVIETAATGIHAYAANNAIEKLVNMHLKSDCRSTLQQQQLHNLIDVLLGNPYFQHASISLFHLHHQKARLYLFEQKLDPTIRHLKAAFLLRHDLNTALMVAAILHSAGLTKDASDYLYEVRQYAPSNPIIRKYWIDMLNKEEQIILAGLGHD